MRTDPIRVALIGLGKMGLSHLAIVNTHPDARLVAVCDSEMKMFQGLNTPVIFFQNYGARA